MYSHTLNYKEHNVQKNWAFGNSSQSGQFFIMKTTFNGKIEVLEELADSVRGHTRSAQFVQVWCHCIQLVDVQWIS